MNASPDHFSWSRYRPIALLITVIVLADIGIGLAAPLWAVRVRDLGGTAAFLGFVVGAVGAARLFTSTSIGFASDRLGRRPLLVAGMVLLALAAIGTAFAPSAPALVGLRLVEGIGWETMNVIGVAFVADLLRGDPRRGRVMSVYQGARRGTQGLSPALGGFLAAWITVRGAFLLYAGFAVAAGALALVAIPAAAGTEVRRTELGDLRRMLMTPRFLALGAVGFVLTGADLAFQQQVIPTVGYHLGLSQPRIGLVLGAYGLLLTLTVFVGGWIVDRFGSHVAITLGFLVTAVGYAIIPFAAGFAALVSSMGIAGLGRGLAGSGPGVFVLDLFPDHQGTAQGAYRSMNSVGRLVVPPVLAALVGVSLGLGVWLVAGALAGTTLNLYRLVRGQEEEKRQSTQSD